jgi:hypothetical protein
MAGMFDDLIPAPSDAGAPPPAGMFDDLIPAPGGKDSGLARNFLAGGNTLLAGALGASGDIGVGTKNLVSRGINAAFGTELPTDRVSPIGSEAIKSGMSAIGIANDQNVEAASVGERVARGAGEAVMGGAVAGLGGAAVASRVGGATGAIAGSMVPRTAGQAATDAGIYAVAGATGKAAEEFAPDEWKPTANLAGNLIGGGLAATATAVPSMAKAGVRQLADFTAPLTEGGQRKMAARTVQGALSDETAVRNSLGQGTDEIVPGSKPTSGQQTGDMGLLALEKKVELQNPEPFNVRRGEQNTARTGAIAGVQKEGAPEAVSAALRTRLAAIDKEATDKIAGLATTARKAGDDLGGMDTPEGYGSKLREAVRTARDAAKTQERSLWAAVDPGDKMALPVTATRDVAKKIRAELPRTNQGELVASLEPVEARLLSIANGMDDVEKFATLSGLRHEVSDALADELSARGQTQTYRRLSMLRGAIEDDIVGAIDNIAAREAEAVAAGTMDVEDTLLNRWEGDAQGLADNLDVQAGQEVVGLSGALPATGTASHFGATRGGGQAAGGPGISAGDPRVPRVEPLTPSFDEGAADRLKVASAATKQRAETFDRASVGEVLKRSGSKGPYKLRDSSVGKQFFVPGKDGFTRVQEYRKAVGDDEAMKTLQDYAVLSMRDTAGVDERGVINVDKMMKWRETHDGALRAFPKLRQSIGLAADLGKLVGEAEARRQATLKAEEYGVLGKLMSQNGTPVDAPEDVVRTVGSIFNKSDSVTTMKSVVDRIGSDPAARTGLRKAVAEHIAEKLISNTEVAASSKAGIKSDQFQTFVRQNEAALRLVFGDEEVKLLKDVAADLQRANRSVTAVRVPGGSDTFQKLSAQLNDKSATAEAKRSILSMLLAVGGGATTGGAGAGVGVLSGIAVNHFRQAGLNNVKELVEDAMLHPERLRLLLTEVTPLQARAFNMNRKLRDVYKRALTVPAAVGQMGKE